LPNITGSKTKPIPLAPLTTFGVGGGALAYRRVKSPAELVAAARTARAAGQKYAVLAGGSNVVFPDGLYRGLVIHYLTPGARPVIEGLGELVVEAGLPLAALIKFAIKNGLAGLEALSGIPGTVGGAIVGNAGAYGQSISDHLTHVQVWDGQKIKWFTKKACRFGYRESIFKHTDYLVLSARFKLNGGESKTLAQKSRQIIKIRNAKYRPGLKCPGSFFKNVLVKDISKTALAKIDQTKIIDGKIPAGYLLEAAGARGIKLGPLYVASFHGNLIVNEDGATAAQVKKLAAQLKNKVFKKFGINLEEEVRYL
jgi:UDP-N-acetylmuramate dehydrogenase